eukprot:1141274-Pelagomonas_calceolata.AAC.5
MHIHCAPSRVSKKPGCNEPNPGPLDLGPNSGKVRNQFQVCPDSPQSVPRSAKHFTPIRLRPVLRSVC